MSVAIREMARSDYDSALALWQSTEGMGLSAADSREAIARYLERNPGLSFVAVTGEGALVGAVLCGHDGRRGYLHHLAVREDFRRQGLARALVERCLACLKAEGIDKCHIFVYHTNTLGRNFWQGMDWAERETLVIMSKDIE